MTGFVLTELASVVSSPSSIVCYVGRTPTIDQEPSPSHRALAADRKLNRRHVPPEVDQPSWLKRVVAAANKSGGLDIFRVANAAGADT
jgi:hypothetical protein